MSAMERIVEAARRLIGAMDEDEYLYALTELREEFAEDPTTTAYINQLIGGYTA